MTRNSPTVLAVVPARGGSKAIPNKNTVLLGGRPLLAYTLEALGGTELVTEHLVSTDDEKIAAVAQQHGGRVPYLRSAELATDTASIVDVVDDVLEREERDFDYILLLQPTAPLRTAEDIDSAIQLAIARDAQSVVSLQEMETYHPWSMYYVKGEQLQPVNEAHHSMPRQQYPVVGWRNGAIYLVKTAVFREQRTFVTEDCVPYFMPTERSVNIDTKDDLELAEHYLRNQEVRIGNRGTA